MHNEYVRDDDESQNANVNKSPMKKLLSYVKG